MMNATPNPTAQLCDWLCSTVYEDLPASLVREGLS
jgi:hypothetical protein